MTNLRVHYHGLHKGLTINLLINQRDKIMQETQLSIKGMSCGHCKMTVEKALKVTDCVDEVEVDLEKGQATVKYKNCLDSLDTLKQAVEDAGYQVV